MTFSLAIASSVRGGLVRRERVRGGQGPPKFLADSWRTFFWRTVRQFAADSARIRADPRGVRRSPPDIRRTSGGVRWSPPKNFFGGLPADPRGSGRTPRGSGRIRADPRWTRVRRLYCPILNKILNMYLIFYSCRYVMEVMIVMTVGMSADVMVADSVSLLTLPPLL